MSERKSALEQMNDLKRKSKSNDDLFKIMKFHEQLNEVMKGMPVKEEKPLRLPYSSDFPPIGKPWRKNYLT